MANFKVGQRVRRIAGGAEPTIKDATPSLPLGAEGTVVWGPGRICPCNAPGLEYIGYVVVYDLYPSGRRSADACDNGYAAEPYTIAPLTDPLADAFIERIKNLKPYEEPVAPKQRERA